MKNSLEKIIWFLVIISGFLFIIVAVISTGQKLAPNNPPEQAEGYNTAEVTLDNNRIKVEIAETETQITRGLSYRPYLAEGQGMLFVFGQPARWSFWMKDMNFSIDMIWFDANLKVVHWESKVSPETFPKSFAPDVPARYVLEVNAGFAEKIGLKLGDKLEFIENNVSI